MKSDLPAASEADFEEWAVDCDEAVAAGSAPAVDDTESVAEAQRQQRFHDCLLRLHQARLATPELSGPPLEPASRGQQRVGRF